MDTVWLKQLNEELVIVKGDSVGNQLYQKYQNAFSAGYREDFTPEETVADILHIEKLHDENSLEIDFPSMTEKKEDRSRFKLFALYHAIPLSDVMPILENMGLRVLEEHPYKLMISADLTVWIHDFSIALAENMILSDLATRALFSEALVANWFQKTENDGFNRLILKGKLAWREVEILRAYAKYLQQAGIPFSPTYIQQVLSSHADIASSFIALFKLKFDPDVRSNNEGLLLAEESILKAIDSVASIDEDHILRHILKVIGATVRTNYSQHKGYLSFKLKSALVPDLPLPLPLFEIFVYSSRVEGVHLRGAKVSRGGIRWSDRREDYRTEILGLMKAQRVKNAVIVPSGSKGGFFPKKLPETNDHTLIQNEVIACYQEFISGLLDLTDNIVKDQVISPEKVVCYDGEDTYLVVAADKGTAAFSDIANTLSRHYGFWLGDAFASGGSAGYDHKKMGITARGAWESVKRHFCELGVNIHTTDFTVVGIGDMSGDVFGNGMLYTPHIKLVAAFDHRHIFLDPNPDPQQSFQERKRLFTLSRSSWEDYNVSLISQGGGIYSRTSKAIKLSPEIKKILDVDEETLDANRLIQAILKSPVDLLWNGGIGAYVKASSERHSDVYDRANDAVRVDGCDIRCRIVGEGGNLGFTQRGRIEYALKGGRINTDSIDNSGGVDCSDHEVNIKILLNEEVAHGRFSEEKRNVLLADLTEEVASVVLRDNYMQALAISALEVHAASQIDFYQSYLKSQESEGNINRYVEFLPDDKAFVERKAQEKGLTRPELAVLLSYAKIHIKNEILKSDLPEDSYVNHIIYSAFPLSLQKTYREQIKNHKLQREIVATQISNDVVNYMGILFVNLMQEETGGAVSEIIRAYYAADDIFKMHELRNIIESVENKIPVQFQYELISYLQLLMGLTTRWILYNLPIQNNIQDVIKPYIDGVNVLLEWVPKLMGGVTKDYLDKSVVTLTKAGVSQETALRIASCRAMYTTLNIIQVAIQNHFDVVKTAKLYFTVGSYFGLLWFRDQLTKTFSNHFWENYLARMYLRDDLDIHQKSLTVTIMQDMPDKTEPEVQIDAWSNKNSRLVERWKKVVTPLHNIPTPEFLNMFLALSELSNLMRNAGQ